MSILNVIKEAIKNRFYFSKEQPYIKKLSISQEADSPAYFILTYQEVINGSLDRLDKWGRDNLQDINFWTKAMSIVREHKPADHNTVLKIVFHFENKDDAKLFSFFRGYS